MCPPIAQPPPWYAAIPLQAPRTWLLLGSVALLCVLGSRAFLRGVTFRDHVLLHRVESGPAYRKASIWLTVTSCCTLVATFVFAVLEPAWSTAIDAWFQQATTQASATTGCLPQVDHIYYHLLLIEVWITIFAVSLLFFSLVFFGRFDAARDRSHEPSRRQYT